MARFGRSPGYAFGGAGSLPFVLVSVSCLGFAACLPVFCGLAVVVCEHLPRMVRFDPWLSVLCGVAGFVLAPAWTCFAAGFGQWPACLSGLARFMPFWLGSFRAVSCLYLIRASVLPLACFYSVVWWLSAGSCSDLLRGWFWPVGPRACLYFLVWLVSCRSVLVPVLWLVLGSCLPLLCFWLALARLTGGRHFFVLWGPASEG